MNGPRERRGGQFGVSEMGPLLMALLLGLQELKRRKAHRTRKALQLTPTYLRQYQLATNSSRYINLRCQANFIIDRL